MRRLIASALMLLAPLLLSAAAYEQLTVDLWCELEPMIQENEDYPLSLEAARRRALEEARGLLSAMIYGMEFTYTPADALRHKAEEFTLSPVAEIRWGDGRLRIAEAEIRENRLYAKVLYDLEDFQSARRRAWASNSIPAASGSGAHSLFTAGPVEGKRRSLEQALKEALRNHLRPIMFNKPREVRGELLLWQAPMVIIDAGSYLTRITAKLLIREVRPYSLF